MAIFAAVTETSTAVSTSAVEVFNSNNSVFASGATLHDPVLINQGPSDVFVGQSGVSATTGLRLPAGAQMSFNGWAFAKNTANANIYAICASGGSATVVSGLGTVDSNV